MGELIILVGGNRKEGGRTDFGEVGIFPMINVKENNGNANTYLAANMLSKDHIENVLLID